MAGLDAGHPRLAFFCCTASEAVHGSGAHRPAMTKNKWRRASGGASPDPIVKQPSFFALAGGFPRELQIVFSISAPGVSVFTPIRGSRAPHGAKSPRPCKEHGTDPAGPASPYGAPLRRFQSLVPHFLPTVIVRRSRRVLLNISPGPHNGAGRLPSKDSRDRGQRNRGRRRRLPIHAQVLLCRAALCGWGRVPI